MKYPKPFFLSQPYWSTKGVNRMKGVDDVRTSRENFIANRPKNLEYLLSKRYSWMNKYIDSNNDKGIEVGSGNGLSRIYIDCENYLITDNTDFDWIDAQVDALQMPYKDEEFDFIVSSNMVHHLAKPQLFFKECYRVLKPGGQLLIQEVNGSFFLRLILKLMKHEGYSYDVDPYDGEAICNDPKDLWSGNNVIPNLLFDNISEFEKKCNFNCHHQEFSEFLLFLLSGGVTAKTKTLQLPKFVLRTIDGIDNLLIFLSKNTFALQRRLVLQKN